VKAKRAGGTARQARWRELPVKPLLNNAFRARSLVTGLATPQQMAIGPYLRPWLFGP
jgi:hypothetical protein